LSSISSRSHTKHDHILIKGFLTSTVFGVGLHQFNDGDIGTIKEDGCPDQEIAVCGDCAIKVCKGSIDAFGFKASASDKRNTWHRISCPWYCSSVVIREDSSYDGACRQKIPSCMMEKVILEELGQYRTVLLLGSTEDVHDVDKNSQCFQHCASGSILSISLLSSSECQDAYDSAYQILHCPHFFSHTFLVSIKNIISPP
jgi:hypothetical protein